MRWRPGNWTPGVICALAALAMWTAEVLETLAPEFSFFRRIEWMTYDWRVRLATRQQPAVSPDLGFVAIRNESIDAVRDGMFGNLPYRFGLYWPRQVYAHLVDELSAQGAAAVGLDVLFAELRSDHPPVTEQDGTQISSDAYFAKSLRAAGNVILAAEKELPPHDLFRTNAFAMADISTEKDLDGILRRVQACQEVRIWHPLLKDAARFKGWDLEEAEIGGSQIQIPMNGGGARIVPLENQNEFDQAALYEELTDRKPPAGFPRLSTAVIRQRCWQMGIVLAARALQLDLARARFEPDKGRIVMEGTNGLTRTIPIDAHGRFHVDWSLTPNHPALTREPIENLLLQHELRRTGNSGDLTNRWKNKLVVVGSVTTGNDLKDLGATPLEKETYLLCQQWNIANSILLDRFVRSCPALGTAALALIFSVLSGYCSWSLGGLRSTAIVIGGIGLYVAASAWLYVQWRWWAPLVFPSGGALLAHASLTIYRVLREQKERRRVTDIFGRIVSPVVRDELLQAPRLALGGVRREITVAFADIRGFTRLADASQIEAEEYVRKRGMEAAEARAHFEAQAQHVLATVNLYLGLMAQEVKRFNGTHDKYIGDCVMAFWGAPMPQPNHSGVCVRAMMELQRTIVRVNQERARENDRRQNQPPLPLLHVGIGISTGLATTGLIGSEDHQLNYTVFGREVNVASRLEEIAEPGRILISEATFLALQKTEPALAASCSEQPPVMLKGIQAPVKNYEVMWQHPETI